MNAVLTPAIKVCRRCKTPQHRSQFRARIGEHNLDKKLDLLCVKCRHTGYFPPKVRESRVERGLMSDRRKARLEEQCAASKAKHAIENARQGRQAGNAITWAKPEASALLALRLLEAYPFDDVASLAWAERAKQMVRDAIAMIQKNKIEYKLPDKKLLFWYDVTDGTTYRLRKLINEYPKGPDECPIKVL